MRKIGVRSVTVTLCMYALMLLLFPEVSLAGDCDEWVAKAVSVQGVVQAKRTGETQWTQVKLNDTFCAGDMLRVQEKSRAAVVLSNETVARLDQETSVTFTGVQEKKVSLLDLLKGAAHFFSRIPRSLRVTTPFVNGAVEGTEFFVKVDQSQTLISVFRGRVLAANDSGSLCLSSNQSALTKAGRAPETYTVARPRDAVRWAIYYPAVVDCRAEEFTGETVWQGKVRKSIRCYREGDLASTFSSIDGIPETVREPRFYIYRAGLLLTVGRVDEAGADIEKALRLDSSNSRAFALQAIIAVSQNKKDEALELARKAANQDPKSSAARVALSYAYQANFQLQAALNSLQEAVALSPKNALAWARLSELSMSAGDLDKALEEAREAASLNPHLARTQTVLGYAYLAQIKTKDSKSAFEKAIELDQAAPLPRLGLGLAKIREGDLKPGRAEIEIAAGLDPNNSLIRSYLGKAFFDEKRDKQSNSQLAIAKELDPQDPTPWFYGAIRKQTINRPIEALHDLQKSIELNDNRVVYRSRLLLDEDLAARSASLGRIYNDLGFEQLALVEGWKSVNTDPSSYSAHRFLADSYAARPRHEIARVSELLQSQLLQPINITPVQPSLAEGNTFIFEGAGPADPSYNEFNPLFLRNRLALQASGVVGGNDIYGDEIAQSGVWGRMSYSVGQFHYETDGFRENNDLEEDSYNVFVQMSLGHKTSMLAEYRDREDEYGDLTQKFDPDNYSPTLDTERDLDYLRLGFRHAFTPSSELIGFVAAHNLDASVEQSVITPGLINDVKLDTDIDGAYLAEIRHLFRSERFFITSGVGHFNADLKRLTKTTTFLNLPIPIPINTSKILQESDIRYTNLYVYSLINYPENVTWTVGASGDFYDKSITGEQDQFNPKFGLTWNPFPETTVRGAVFRVLKREFVVNQTIEPTQVAGFNQFFDEVNAADSWRYGIAIDQKLTAALYGGAEFTERDIETPYQSLTAGTYTTHHADWEENMLRAYLYWTPYSWLAASGEYSHERLKREEEQTGLLGAKNVDTHRFALGANFFHVSGFRAGLNTSYIDQEGSFQDITFSYFNGSDDFWVVDAFIGYRLPKRWGIFTLEVKNLFDEEFKYQETDPAYPHVYPERLVIGRLTLSF